MKVPSVLRVLPFTALALASIWAANRAPDGRRPPQMDFTVTPEAIANALTKVPHIASMALLFVLAVLATGYSRVWLAAVLTFLVGVSWELGAGSWELGAGSWELGAGSWFRPQ
ncbi:hypothetical protein Brsp07_04195 [Brucella sp. NBRC 14130]|uniref:hypothetical protein n=1 Tax=Brucella sp. NBRC 14130 TaxID=3075483 RepID=UPI0030B25F58